MKHLITFSFAIVIAFSGMAQAPIYVEVETTIQGNDTLRTFFVDGAFCKKVIDELITDYGVPEGAGTGTMKWDGVTVPNVGTGLSIHGNDGARIFDQPNNTWSFSTFLNGADMNAKLSVDPARARRMYITLKKGSKNKANSAQAEAAVISFIEEMILAY
jgi:hypothetical protein